jgi:hypothetical protein
MTYKIKDGTKDIEFMFEGQEDEVLRLYHKVTGLVVKPLQQTLETARTEQKPRISMPTDQEVEEFIKSRPDYEHDLHIVQNQFFGRTFQSRGPSMHMYHKTNRQLRSVREKIEREEGRKFKEEIVERNFKHYRVEPLGKYVVTKSDLSVTT